MSKAREILVLQFSGEEIRLASARSNHGVVEISSAAAFPTTKRGDDVATLHDQTLTDALKAHVRDSGWKGRDAIALVSGPYVGCHYFEMPPLKRDAMRQAILLKLAQQLHFDVSAAVVAIDTNSASVGRSRTGVVALHQDLARCVVEIIEEIGLQLLSLSSAPSSLALHAASDREGMHGQQAVLHIDENTSTLTVLDGDKPYVVTELSLGGADFVAALMRPIISGDECIQLDQAAATTLRDEIGIPAPDARIVSLEITGDRILPLLEPVLQKFSKQITQWLSFAATCNGGVVVKSLQLVGPGTSIRGLGPALAGRLSIEVGTESWLDDKGSLQFAAADGILDRYGFAVSAIRNCERLPDLIPAKVRQQNKSRRLRASITRCSPFLAAAMLVLAVSFDSLYDNLQPNLRTQRSQSDALEQVVHENVRWASYRGGTRILASQIDEFTRASPPWHALFKQLSATLPAEMRAIEVVGRPVESGTKLIVKAAVYPSNSKSFDELAAQTVLALQKSPFFRRVEMSANRGSSTEDPLAAGTVSFEMDLIYPKPRVKT